MGYLFWMVVLLHLKYKSHPEGFRCLLSSSLTVYLILSDSLILAKAKSQAHVYTIPLLTTFKFLYYILMFVNY